MLDKRGHFRISVFQEKERLCAACVIGSRQTVTQLIDRGWPHFLGWIKT